jgi:hypothetical protein
MAITFRSVKGTALTHAEIDQNFSEFIYSGSVSGSDLILYRSQSDQPELIVPLVKSSGPIGAVNLTAPGNVFTGSHDFKYDYERQNLMITGSFFQEGDQYINGTIFARQFQTTLVSASIIFRSGSTKFGDSEDDQHNFTGYVNVSQNVTAIGDLTAGNNISASNTISGSNIWAETLTGALSGSVSGIGDVVAFSSSVDARLAASEEFSSSLNDTFATDQELSNLSASIVSTIDNVSASIVSTIDNVSASLQDSIDTKVPYGFSVELTGDTVGSGFLSGTGLSINTTIADDSHNHTISNIDGLQSALNAKASITQLNASSSAILSTLTTDYQTADTALLQSVTSTYVKKSGDIISGDLTITGDLQIQGTQTSINTTNLVVTDKLISIASGSTTAAAANGAGLHVSGANAEFTYDAATDSWTSNKSISANFIGTITGSIDNADKLDGQHGTYYLDYSNFTNKPTIPTVPTNVSAFTNDAGYTTFDGTYNSLTGKPTIPTVPTNVSAFTNDAGYTTFNGAYSSLTGKPTIPTNNNQLTNGAGYTTYTSNQATNTNSNVTFSTVNATGDIIAFASSDERLKDNVKAIPNAVVKVQQIGGYEFDWNNNSSHSGHDIGVIAQEIEKVLPEIVTTRDDGYKAVRYEKIVALLIQAVKEQQLQIDELKSKL